LASVDSLLFSKTPTAMHNRFSLPAIVFFASNVFMLKSMASPFFLKTPTFLAIIVSNDFSARITTRVDQHRRRRLHHAVHHHHHVMLIRILGEAAGGKVASSDVVALIGFAALNYCPSC
jgi:hypothetical protein